MPALVAFGRRWHFGSDDFVGPGVFDLVIRILWVIVAVISVIYWMNTDLNLSCSGGFHIQIYLYGVFVILPLIIIVDSFLIHNTKAGGPMDEHARRFVPLCLYVRLFFMLVEVIWTLVGSIWWVSGSMNCTLAPQAEAFARDRILSSWLVIAVWTSLLIIMFDPIGGNKTNRVDVTSVTPFNMRKWEWKIRLYFYNFFSGNRKMINEGFEEAGNLFDMFFEDSNLVPSDVFTGMTLLVHKYMTVTRNNLNKIQVNPTLSIETTIPAVTEEPRSSGSHSQPVNLLNKKWNSLPMVYHMEKYAIAGYHVVFGYSDPIHQLWKGSLCCGCLRNMPMNVEGDNCCYLGTSAIKAMVNIDNSGQSDIKFVSFKNDVFQTPFFVAVDHQTKSVIVAIRGSRSINDILVNLAAKPHPIDVPGLPSSFKAHHGMLQCAQMLKKKLDSLHVLPKLFSKYPEYNLVLTGTSLGAGASTILGLIMKAQYPSLKCYAYAPPGLLLSLDAAEYCESFVLSIVYENDVVPRTSVTSLETLKYQIVSAVNTCKVPKYKVLFGGFFWYWFGVGFPKVSYDDNNDCNNDADDGISNQYQPIINSCQNIAVEIGNEETPQITSSGIPPVHPHLVKKLVPFESMYPPGKIIHITESESYSLGHRVSNYKGSPRWNVRWAQRSEFREIILSPRMIADHLPFRTFKALRYFTDNGDELDP